MKAIILLSSIFYIIGLKIGHKIDLFKNVNPVEKISTSTNAVKPEIKTVYYNDVVKCKNDSTTIENVNATDKSLNKKELF